MSSAVGPQMFSQLIDPTEVGRRLASNYGLEDFDSLIKSQDQLAEENEAQQAQAATQAAVPALAKAGADAITQEAQG